MRVKSGSARRRLISSWAALADASIDETPVATATVAGSNAYGVAAIGTSSTGGSAAAACGDRIATTATAARHH
jgi:hypothetical protein